MPRAINKWTFHTFKTQSNLLNGPSLLILAWAIPLWHFFFHLENPLALLTYLRLLSFFSGQEDWLLWGLTVAFVYKFHWRTFILFFSFPNSLRFAYWFFSFRIWFLYWLKKIVDKYPSILDNVCLILVWKLISQV